MKKILFTVLVGLSSCLFAGPHHGGPRPGGHGPAPMHGPRIQHTPPPRHHHSNFFWGHGGSNFWPGFIGGVVGSAFITPPLPPRPVVVPAPVITTPVVVPSQPTVIVTQPVQVWVEGRYVDQVQPNGTIIKIWQPGHYEIRH